MNIEEVGTEVKHRFQELTSPGFTNLVRVMFKNVTSFNHFEDAWYISSNPSEPDIVAEFGTDPLVISFGGRAWQFDGPVRKTSVEQFIYILERNSLDIGCFVTSSSFTSDAITSAENSPYPIRLVDGDDLSKLLAIHDIGVSEDNGGFQIEDEFWRSIDRPRERDKIPSNRIPQADNIAILIDTVRAVHSGNSFKPQIRYYLEQKTGRDWRPRQASYYAQACVLLGLLSKSSEHYQGRLMNKFDLTIHGRDLLEAINESTERKEEILEGRIREVVIIRRMVGQIRDEGPTSEDELFGYFESQIEIPETSATAKRRFSTVKSWLSKLREIERNESGDSATYRFIQPQETFDHYV